MIEQESQWHQFKNPSTFTFPGRNAVATQEVGELLQNEGHGKIESIVLVGSGPIEPFVTAALPISEDARVIAIDPDANVLELLKDLKQGLRVGWEDFERVCRNGPDVPNSDFSGQRLRASIEGLRMLGVAQKLGIDSKGLKIPRRLADNVEVFEGDGIKFMTQTPQEYDLLVEGFVRANINKLEGGKDYSQELLNLSIEGLREYGVCLIGDTGFNLPTTLNQVFQSNAGGILLLNLAHAIQYAQGKFITSHYLIAGERDPFEKSEDLVKRVRQRIEDNHLLQLLNPQEATVTDSELESASKEKLLISFIEKEIGSGTAFVSEMEALEDILPLRGELNPDIALTRQKAELPADEITIFRKLTD